MKELPAFKKGFNIKRDSIWNNDVLNFATNLKFI
jgi:hypothetical protein